MQTAPERTSEGNVALNMPCFGIPEQKQWDAFGPVESASCIWKMLLNVPADDGMTFGISVMRAGCTFQKHQHRAPEIYIYLQGKGTIMIGDKTFPAKRGRLYFIPGGTPHMTTAAKDSDLLFAFIFPFNIFDNEFYSEFDTTRSPSSTSLPGSPSVASPPRRFGSLIADMGRMFDPERGRSSCVLDVDNFSVQHRYPESTTLVKSLMDNELGSVTVATVSVQCCSTLDILCSDDVRMICLLSGVVTARLQTSTKPSVLTQYSAIWLGHQRTASLFNTGKHAAIVLLVIMQPACFQSSMPSWLRSPLSSRRSSFTSGHDTGSPKSAGIDEEVSVDDLPSLLTIASTAFVQQKAATCEPESAVVNL